MENIIIAIIQTKYFDFSDAISFEFFIFYIHITSDVNYFNLKGEFQNFENYEFMQEIVF